MSIYLDDHSVSVVCNFCRKEVRKCVDGRNPGVVDAPPGFATSTGDHPFHRDRHWCPKCKVRVVDQSIVRDMPPIEWGSH